ncbi:MAG: PaaI family thioesterase [Halioglobus sp.]|jgi:acyl-coenzyme A thioesterase PaaI-like protein|nr:PaaI family thioesterase [Halioglobus sp.]|tara:strand:- start:6804 stop:7445 length:642 start_codon:yes stop_codon:yes gene_type:complete
MSDESAERENNGLSEAVNRDVSQLINHLRCSDAPDEVLAKATEHIQQALSTLKPWLQEGEGWSTISIGGDVPGFPWQEDDLTAVMPYSPVSGKRNPVAPPMRLWKAGESEVKGEVIFSPTYAGPPDSVHGGIIAAVFDEILAMANVISGTAGFTGTLTIKYRRKTPLNTPIELWGKNIRQDGRKQLCHGEMRVNGEVTASAEGLFICAAELNE